MKGFIDEFNERTDSMTTLITELESQLKEKDKNIEELKKELSQKDEENKMALTEVFEENQNLKKQISEQDVALAELYESMLNKNA